MPDNMSENPSADARAIAPRDEQLPAAAALVAMPTPMGGLLPQWWINLFGPGCMFRTSLDLTKPSNKALLLRSINEDAETAKSVLNLPLDIVAYTVSPASRLIEGELQEWVRCVLHLADGRSVACGSIGIVKSLLMIEQIDRRAPWNPPMRKVLKAKDIAGGRQWFYLADPPEADAPAGKRKG